MAGTPAIAGTPVTVWTVATAKTIKNTMHATAVTQVKSEMYKMAKKREISSSF
jgi:hypothetical protein